MGHPLDSLKVLMQANSSTTTASTTAVTVNGAATTTAMNNGASAQLRSMHTAAVVQAGHSNSHLKKRSLMNLYKGIGTPLLTAGVMHSVNFMLYDSMRRMLYNCGISSSSSSNVKGNYCYDDDILYGVALSGGTAGAVVSLYTSPLQLIKTKQQLMLWSLRQSLVGTYQQGGVKAFYAGFGAHCYCDSIGRAVYLGSYEFTKREIRKSKMGEALNVWERMFSAGVAGIICWTAIFPADVIRCRIYHSMAKASSCHIPSTAEMARHIYRNDGINGFFRGFTITVLRAGPVASIVLPIYDIALEFLQAY